MSKNSEIGWTHHTANPWWGCVKISPACDHCYASVISARLSRSLFGHTVPWEPGAEQGHKMDELEREAPRWDRAAAKAGEQHRVFCGSMCDWAEGRADQKPSLSRLFPLIERTPNLAWLLLTKRPNIGKRLLSEAYRPALPPNIWVGSTVENQEWAERRLPHLLSIDAAVRFVSVEPQLGPVELRPHLGPGLGKVNWVICGGESGPRARGSDEVVGWYRALRDQCVETGAKFFFKQWGRFRQEGEALIKLRGKNPDNALDGVRWEQYPEPSGPPVDEPNR